MEHVKSKTPFASTLFIPAMNDGAFREILVNGFSFQESGGTTDWQTLSDKGTMANRQAN